MATLNGASRITFSILITIKLEPEIEHAIVKPAYCVVEMVRVRVVKPTCCVVNTQGLSGGGRNPVGFAKWECREKHHSTTLFFNFTIVRQEAPTDTFIKD